MHRLYLLIVLLLSCTSVNAIQKQAQPAPQQHEGSMTNTAAGNEKANPMETQPRGEMLYKNHCHACHESNAHVRDNKRAKSFADILSWVTRWSSHLNLDWNAQDIDQVARHLNKTYYKFSNTQ